MNSNDIFEIKNSKEEITTSFCDKYGVQANWVKIKDRFFEDICDFVEEDHDEDTGLCGYSKRDLMYIGLTVLGIAQHQVLGETEIGLKNVLTNSKPTKSLYKQGRMAIDESRIALAERIRNGAKGGRPSKHDDMQED